MFFGVKVLMDISFDCYVGQVYVLMGENGVGKLIFLKIFSGNYVLIMGFVVINGQEMFFFDMIVVFNVGVVIIYQELYFVLEMIVVENIYFGQLLYKGGIVNCLLLNYEVGL